MPELSVTAPNGAHFDWDEVKTKRGTESLGDVPLLVWDSAESMFQFYGEECILSMADGTSLRVSFQSIARRMRAAGKSDDDIAKAQIEFRPGRRSVGASTPSSRAARSAKKAIESGSVDAERLQKLLDKIAAGEISAEDVEALTA